MRQGCLCTNWPVLVLSRALVGSAQVHVSNWIKIKKKSNQPGSPVLGCIFFTFILEKGLFQLDSSQVAIKFDVLEFWVHSRLPKILK